MSLELKRSGADGDLDDSDWIEVPVPGHWGQVQEFENHNGPMLYRRRFTHPPTTQDQRLWLRFNGVLSEAEVWLDGHYIGDTTSYFASDRFEVSELLDQRADHLLAVEVACPASGDSASKTSLTGSLQSGHLAPQGNPGGLWRGVAIDSTGPVAIRHSRLLCTNVNSNRATLQVRLVLDAAHQTEIRVDTSVAGPDGSSAAGGSERHSLASGENRIEWSVEIENPRLWWPFALGEQPLYEVAVAVRMSDGELSDRRDWRTGLRRVSMDNFIWRVNGQRLFVKGIVAGPPGRFGNDTRADLLREDVRRVRDAGLDMLRVYGHIARPELYDEADRLGILVWQDLPLVGGYSSKARSSIRAMTRLAVDYLGHHPSIGLWCGHNDPNGQILGQPPEPVAQDPMLAASPNAGSPNLGALGPLDFGRRIGRHLGPSWNRSILDPIIARELRNADRSRPIVARSGGLPSPADPGGSDTHLWLGWHAGRPEDLPTLVRRWPRLAAFLGGIGTQSAAVDSGPDWEGKPAPTWPGAERGAFARYLPRQAYADGHSWAAASQAYQADVIRTHVETLRRLKYTPAGGFCIEALADIEAEGGFGVYDAARKPKLALEVLVDSCRPVVVIADPPPPLVVPGQWVSMAVHVVSDLRSPLGQVRVTGHAHDENAGGWSQTTVWEGDVPADSCHKVGDFVFTIPWKTGTVSIDLALESSGSMATNRYRTVIIPFSEAIRTPNR